MVVRRHPWDVLEIWRPVTDFPYEVSSWGRVRRVTGGQGAVAGRILKASIDHKGYHRVYLCLNGTEFTKKVHSLVCEAFRGPRPTSEHEVAHGGDNKNNNRATNLKWATRSQNSIDRVLNEHDGHAKLTIEQAVFIRIHTSIPRALVAKQFGISISAVRDCRARRTYWYSDGDSLGY